MGLAVGGALIGWMLAAGGYQAGAASQTSATITTITLLFTIAPGICYLLCAVTAKAFYKLDTKEMLRVNATLKK